MGTRRTYTDDQREEALHLYELEGPTAVEKKLGIPKNTVARWANARGLRTVRNQKTGEATKARVVDAKAVRAAIASDGIETIQSLHEVIKARIAQGLETESFRDIATVYGILTDKHKMLVEMDRSTEEHSAVDAWLDHIMGGPANTD